jgi:hypothetical protein
MKDSTKIAVVLIMSLLWCVGTILAISDGLLIVNSLLATFMVSVPFLSFFCSLLVYILEHQNETNKTI